MLKPLKKIFTAPLFIFLLVVFVLMYLFNCFTPRFSDDWHYVFIYGTTIPIKSLGDVFLSQYIHYFELHGRSIVHFIDQVFDALIGKPVFNVFNAAFFPVFLYLIAVVTSQNKAHYYKIASVAFILLFLLMPGFKHEFFWMSGSLNYLWVITAVLIFHLLLFKEEFKKWTYVPLFFWGVICGWSNEGIVLGLAAAYFIYFAINRKELHGHRIYMLVGFFIGVLIMSLAPGSINRALGDKLTGHVGFYGRFIHLFNMRLFFILVFYVAYRCLFKKMNLLEWMRKEMIFVITVIVSLIFVFLTGTTVLRSRFGVEFFSLLLLLRFINWNALSKTLVTVANVVVLAFGFYMVTISYNSYKIAESELAQINSDHCIVSTVQPIKYSFFHRYVLDYSLSKVVRYEKYYGELLRISNFYGYKDVKFFPKEFLDDLQANPDAYDQFRGLGSLPFYAKRLDGSQDIKGAQVQFDPAPKQDWWSSVKYLLFGEHARDYFTRIEVMSVYGNDYVFVPRLYPTQDYRLKTITLM